MPKELTMEVVRGCIHTQILIVRLNGRTPPEFMLILVCDAASTPLGFSISPRRLT